MTITITIASVGASGALYGVMGCIVLDLILNWKLVENRRYQVTRLSLILLVSFLLGLLPSIDNMTHIGGFLTGLFSGVTILPNINFGHRERRIKTALRWLFVPILVLWYSGLSVAFVGGDAGKSCPWCKYLDCVPSSFISCGEEWH
jgi:Mn2+/Fe2+ NRAMP family transporter